VGPNGAGKSTLLKLMLGELQPTKGTVTRHTHLSIGRFHQHSVEALDDSKSPLDFFKVGARGWGWVGVAGAPGRPRSRERPRPCSGAARHRSASPRPHLAPPRCDTSPPRRIRPPQATYPNVGGFKREDDEWRSYLGRFGVTGRLQTNKIGQVIPRAAPCASCARQAVNGARARALPPLLLRQ
jgi:energy-coupling factor transporter ATP-binding protein EcfA2